MMKRIFFLLLSGLLHASVAWAWAGPGPVVYARQHELLVHAIQDGHAEGVISGALAERFTQQFGDGPLLAKVSVIQHYRRADCKRLLVELSKREASEDAGAVERFSLNIKLNYCLAGPPPALLEAAP